MGSLEIWVRAACHVDPIHSLHAQSERGTRAAFRDTVQIPPDSPLGLNAEQDSRGTATKLGFLFNTSVPLTVSFLSATNSHPFLLIKLIPTGLKKDFTAAPFGGQSPSILSPQRGDLSLRLSCSSHLISGALPTAPSRLRSFSSFWLSRFPTITDRHFCLIDSLWQDHESPFFLVQGRGGPSFPAALCSGGLSVTLAC